MGWPAHIGVRRTDPFRRRTGGHLIAPIGQDLAHVGVFADGGYAGNKLRDALAQLGKWTIEIIKRSELLPVLRTPS